MIRGRSPPKHRHDGISPLPMGMDWSPPPKIWNGRDTVWPHDPRTGWSYCVTIPSWVALPKSRSSASDPVVFYRVQVGIQSPEGITTTRGVLRRFNDFLKLFSDLKKAFPKKALPSAPPKGLLRMKSRTLLEERRYSLEEWMSKLLSDIDISRSMVVASFLELEAATRASFQESTQPPSDVSPTNSNISSHRVHPTLTASSSITSDYGSDTAYETSELGSPSLERDDGSETGLEEMALDNGFSSPMENLMKYSMSNIEEGLLMGESILDQLEGFKKDKLHTKHVTDDGNTSKAVSSLTADGVSRVEQDKLVNHIRKHSNESVGSDLSSFRGSEMSNLWAPNLLSEGSLDITNGSEVLGTMGSPSRPELQPLSGGQIILPRDQQPKLDRILMLMQRRLVTAKTDMEDLITRLNQEIAVKEFLNTKVKDLEGELESTREKSKETLQQAVSLEKDRITKMQWDMEELRQKSLEMELKLKSQEDSKVPTGSASLSTFSDRDELLKELEATKGHLDNLRKQHEELEVKAKSDVRTLVKEVRSLRRSQNELKEKLEESLQSKSEVERELQQEMERSEQALAARKKLLHDCQTLQIQLQLCNIKLEDDNFVADSSSISKVLDLLSESDKQVGLVLVKTQDLAPDADSSSNDNDVDMLDHELRLVLRDLFCNSAKMRKQVNIYIRSAFQTDTEDNKDAPSTQTLLKQVLEPLN